jgi:hypothetical protein
MKRRDYIDLGVVQLTKNEQRSRNGRRASRERVIEFPTLASLARFCADGDSPRHWSLRESECISRNDWFGADSLEQAVDWALNGNWDAPDVAELIAAYDKGTTANLPTFRFESDLVGVRANVPAFCAGTPDSMFQFVESESYGRVIRLAVGRSYSAAVPADVIVHVCSRVLAWIASIEQHSKISVELTLLTSENQCGLHNVTLCTVKRAGEALDLSEIAFALVCPAFFRRLCFRVIESLPRDCQNHGYGYPGSIPDHIKKRFDLVLPCISASSMNQAALEARRYIEALDNFVEAG